MRIHEQELYIIRLTLQLHEVKESKEEEIALWDQKALIEGEIKDTEHLITRFTEIYNRFDEELRENNELAV